MNWNRPERDELLRAIDVYLSVAYATVAAVPKVVLGRVDPLRALPPDDGGAFLAQRPFEAEPPDAPARYFLRLGNASYPHMKLVVDRAPDGVGHLFRADTHDRHIRPAPGTPDADAFAMLMVTNQEYAEKIELAWDAAGLPTFKAFLREDLARRRAAAGG